MYRLEHRFNLWNDLNSHTIKNYHEKYYFENDLMFWDSECSEVQGMYWFYNVIFLYGNQAIVVLGW